MYATSPDVARESTILRTAMEKYCRVFDGIFQESLDTLEAHGVSPKVDCFVRNFSYNIQRESLGGLALTVNIFGPTPS